MNVSPQPGTGRNRIIDKTAVVYPYPRQIGSTYKKDYESKLGGRGEVFNLEREHKIINPHKMELRTTSKSDYQPYKLEPKKKKVARPQSAKVPFQKTSSYGARKLCSQVNVIQFCRVPKLGTNEPWHREVSLVSRVQPSFQGNNSVRTDFQRSTTSAKNKLSS